MSNKTFLTGVHEIDRVFGGLPINTVWTHLDIDSKRGDKTLDRFMAALRKQNLRAMFFDVVPEERPSDWDLVLVRCDEESFVEQLRRAQHHSVYGGVGTILSVNVPERFLDFVERKGTVELARLYRGELAERCDLVTATLPRPYDVGIWMSCLKSRQRGFGSFEWPPVERLPDKPSLSEAMSVIGDTLGDNALLDGLSWEPRGSASTSFGTTTASTKVIDALDIDDLVRRLPVGQNVRRLAVRIVREAGQRGGSVLVDLVANLISRANEVDLYEEERNEALEDLESLILEVSFEGQDFEESLKYWKSVEQLRRLESLILEVSFEGQDFEESLKYWKSVEQLRRKAIDLLIEHGVDRDEMDSDLLKGIKLLAERDDDD